jgi:predicted  nucleic acid-binding Zn-ribbon protein
MAIGWIKSKLGITDLEQRVNTLESKISTLESKVDVGLKRLGRYNSRTKEELVLMRDQIDDLIAISNANANQLEIMDEKERAKKLLKRLKNHKTRVANQLEQIGRA